MSSCIQCNVTCQRLSSQSNLHARMDVTDGLHQVIAYELRTTPKRGVVRVTWPIFNLGTRSHISETAEARVAKFCIYKIYQVLALGDDMGVVIRVTWPVSFKILPSLLQYIFGIGEVRHCTSIVVCWIIQRSRPWRRPISSTNCVEFPWLWSRQLTNANDQLH